MSYITQEKEEAGGPIARSGAQPGNSAGHAAPLNALIITLLIQALVSAAVLAPTVIAPAITHTLGLPASAVGIYAAVVYSGAVCSTLYSGMLISKWGPIRSSQAGLLLCALGLIFVTSGVLEMAVLGAALVGLGYGPITPASSHILIKTTPREKLSTLFSIKQTGVPLGGVMVGLMIPPQELAFGWTWALLSVSAGCVLMCAAGQFVRNAFDGGRMSHRTQSPVSGIIDPIRLVASHPGLRILAACSFVFSGVQMAVSVYLPTYLNVDLGWSLLAAGFAISVAQIAGMVGRVLWGIIADRSLGANVTLGLITGLMVASCIGAALLTAKSPPFLVFSLLVVFGASAIGWNGVYLSEVARIAPPGAAGMATGGTLAVTFSGIVLWPPVFGQLADMAGGTAFPTLDFACRFSFALFSFFARATSKNRSCVSATICARRPRVVLSHASLFLAPDKGMVIRFWSNSS
jgi:sugar phosphate permease